MIGKDLWAKIDLICHQVASYFGLKVQELKSTSRTKSVAVPRQIAIYLIRKHTDIGFKDLGKIFGGKDHSTTLYAYRKISDAVRNNAAIREAVQKIQTSLMN